MFSRREAAFHSGCVAKGRRFASVTVANLRGLSQEGVCRRPRRPKAEEAEARGKREAVPPP